MPEAGDTFILTLQQTRGTPHLWVLLWGPSGPADAFLAVYLTTLRAHSDRSCILVPGDHPFIRHERAVAYHETVRITSERLKRAIHDGNAYAHSPVDATVLQAMREGFFASAATPHAFKEWRAGSSAPPAARVASLSRRRNETQGGCADPRAHGAGRPCRDGPRTGEVAPATSAESAPLAH